MSLDTLAQIGEFIGGVAVLITLIYLVKETRQNTQAIKASTFHSANASLAELNLRIAENPSLGALVSKGFDPEFDRSDMSDQDWYQFGVFCRSMFNSFETMHVQYEQGLLPKDIWEKRIGTCKWFVSALPAWQIWWAQEKMLGIQIESFVTAVEQAKPMGSAKSYSQPSSE